MKRTIRLKQSELKRMISESVKRVLRESIGDYDSWYPENDDMMDDYYYGMMMTFSAYMFDLTEEAIQNLTSTKDEYCDNSRNYVSVMVTNVDVKKDNEFGDYDIIIKTAVSAPEMPINAIEKDAEEQIWCWFVDKTDERPNNLEIIEEEEVFDRRTEKYK